MLVDRVEITVKAGRGGDGIVSWRREKYVPLGGPDGGDGGRGGSVIFRVSSNVDTLAGFRYRKVFHAEDGETGRSKKQAGAAGNDLELTVPPGTIIKSAITGFTFHDLKDETQTVVIARGGRGGLGNVHFVHATNQQPHEATPGKPGEEKNIVLELQLIADLAFIGEPNVGKSSLLAALTDANVRIGDYAFSTTEPSLGVLKVGRAKITLVDMPGLLAGAHDGKGLGDEFLRHAMRVKAFLQVIDATTDVAASEAVIAKELELYSPELAKRPRLLVINKIDLLTSAELKDLKKQYPKAIYVAATDSNTLTDLKTAIVDQWQQLS